MVLLLLLLGAQLAGAEDLPARQIVNDVKCAADAHQSYALYLPSSYSRTRSWPVIFAFDPAARGRIPVDRYQAAAEQYGYIVAGSNNSRNGPWEVSLAAARAMIGDVTARFRIDDGRIYTAGMSGGSRVALGLALGSKGIAGVMASSAGFPDSTPRKRIPFAIFGTAGTEDFNLMEMRRVDRALASPHRLAVFAGGHSWPPAEVATQAVEWMELQALKSAPPADRTRIDQLYARRLAALEGLSSDKDRYLALEDIATDFQGLKEVSDFAAKAAALGRDKHVREALKKDRDEESSEQHEYQQIVVLESRLPNADQRSDALNGLRATWKKLSTAANASSDSADRRIARRLLRGLFNDASQRVDDAEYRKILDEFRPARPAAPTGRQ